MPSSVNGNPIMRIVLMILIGASSCKGPAGQKEVPVRDEKNAMAKVMLTDLKDKPINLDQYKGRTVFINFWATWCNPYLREMPLIKRAQDSLSKYGIVFLLASDESSEEIIKFEKNYKYNFNYARVVNLEELGVQGLPTTYIFNPSGKLAFSETGFRKWDDSTNIEMILKINSQK